MPKVSEEAIDEAQENVDRGTHIPVCAFVAAAPLAALMVRLGCRLTDDRA